MEVLTSLDEKLFLHIFPTNKNKWEKKVIFTHLCKMYKTLPVKTSVLLGLLKKIGVF